MGYGISNPYGMYGAYGPAGYGPQPTNGGQPNGQSGNSRHRRHLTHKDEILIAGSVGGALLLLGAGLALHHYYKPKQSIESPSGHFDEISRNANTFTLKAPALERDTPPPYEPVRRSIPNKLTKNTLSNRIAQPRQVSAFVKWPWRATKFMVTVYPAMAVYGAAGMAGGFVDGAEKAMEVSKILGSKIYREGLPERRSLTHVLGGK